MSKITARAMLEMPDGSFVARTAFTSPAMTGLALAVVKKDIKTALHGLGPIFGKDLLLSTCLEIINEDFNPDGPQTAMPDFDVEGEA